MKKIIILLLMCISSAAQAQIWAISESEADELKGTKAYKTYLYVDEDRNILTFWDDVSRLRIESGVGIFNYSTDTYTYHTIKTVIGFYESDSLVRKCSARFMVLVSSGKANTAYLRNKKIVGEIIEHLKNKGDIRILAPIYGEGTFDLMVPMMTNDNTIKE